MIELFCWEGVATPERDRVGRWWFNY